MSTTERLDVKKRKDLVALEELEGRDVPCPSTLATKDLLGNAWCELEGFHEQIQSNDWKDIPTLDDLAEDTGSHYHGLVGFMEYKIE
jgi:hypothetical protein